ncbi:hypothetical protein WOLCODRAFT_16726 [Wolfiporia cocos MD-104 SS10]|uniref:INO80 complex subunit F domain-containing protein n=1 Tax=Wolfiporia cocos (strain MD-104) TaxID=742152 RepID=A0A2H3JPY3_WOLCO|nr:hypothetical protein WOLCODRAFT_16726 [Wolfiporia cocos MD-104 SS10]
MSRQPSPGPSVPPSHAPALFHSPAVANNPQFIQKQKNKTFVAGITAGVEDVKYQAKYKELKKKVKEIEARAQSSSPATQDNDRLFFKVNLAKKNIRRMHLERAILYERLAAVPPTPGREAEELPPDSDPYHRAPVPPPHAPFISPNDREVSEWLKKNPDARMVVGHDGRVVSMEVPPPRVTDAPLPPMPPHGIPLVYGYRHDAAPGLDVLQARGQVPILPGMAPPHMVPVVLRPGEAPPALHLQGRVGPGANINRDMEKREQQERERAEREAQQWELGEEAFGSGRDADYARQQKARQARADAGPDHDEPMQDVPSARDATPSSGPAAGGSRDPSRPASGQSTQTERARQGAASIRGGAYPEDRASGSEAARGITAEMGAPPAESRKRYRAEMEAGDEHGGDVRSPSDASRGSSGQGTPKPDARGAKRRHADDGDEELRGDDSREERMDED